MRTPKNLPSLVLLLIASTSCSTFRKSGAPSDEPLAAPAPQGAETVAIAGTNDLHGALVPMAFMTREDDGSAPVPYQAGGVAWLASYLDVLRAEHGSRFLWLDGGDEFQGTIESNSEQGAGMVRFFNSQKLTAAAIGNHEFDFGPETGTAAGPPAGGKTDELGALKARMREATYPYLAANIVEKGTGKAADFPNTRPSKIVSAGSLRIGLIGLSTLDTPRTTRSQYVAKLEFTDLREAVLREAASLRSSGADAVVAVGHVGLRCEIGRVTPGHTIRKPTDPQGECEPSSELVKLLSSLPAGTLDAFVSGHSHQVVHHWVSGVPVIQGGSNGRYFNVIYLSFDSKRKLIPELARIEGPIPVCPAVFANQRDCNGDRKPPPRGRGELVAPELHGKKIKADSSVEKMLEKIVESTGVLKAQVVGEAARRITHERFEESELGDLVADAVREVAGADVGLVNSGGLRAPIEQGKITYGDVFRSLPFENSVVTVKMTGKQLLLLLRIAQSGSRGFAGVSGVNLRLIHPKADAPSSDLDGNGRIDAWEVNRLIEAKLTGNREIDPNRVYRVATPDFLALGGDDLGWFFSTLPKESFSLEGGPVMRDAAIARIRKLMEDGPINRPDRPILFAAEPRLKFETPSKKGSGTKKGRKRKRRH